jgi:hypothetical protein
MKYSLFAAKVVLSAVVLPARVICADVVVASNLPPLTTRTTAWEEVGLISPTYNNYNNVGKGQAFVAASSGALTTVEALVARGTTPGQTRPPLRVSVYTASDGLPIEVLGTKQYTSGFGPVGSSSNTRVAFDFRDLLIRLEAGSEYFIAFETPFGNIGTNGTHAPYFVGFSIDPPETHLGRPLALARNSVDWEIYSGKRELFLTVRATPEPTSIAMLVPACILASLVRRRRPSH